MSNAIPNIVFSLLLVAAACPQALAQAAPEARNSKSPRVNRVDSFAREISQSPPADPASLWAKQAAAVRQGMEAAMGKLPPGLPRRDRRMFRQFADATALRIEETRDFKGYRRAKLSFEVAPGDRVPCFLLVPTGAGVERPGPAVLALHQTTPYGKSEVADETIDPKKSRPNMRYGVELARRGIVVLAPDYPSFGEYAYDFKNNPFPSGTMKGIVNHIACVDLLRSRPEVDPERIGAIGHSLGGHNAIFVAAFDDRIAAVVSCCGWCPFREYYDGNIKGWTSDRYMPRLKDVYGLDVDRVPFEFDEVIASLAPRGFLSVSPIGDANFSATGVRRGVASAARVYAAFSRKENLQTLYPDCQHDFPPDMREAAYRFLAGQLARRSNPR